MTRGVADQIDAVDPANIAAEWDGLPAARVTVFANLAGQVFDVSDTGNAPPATVAAAVRQRLLAGKWSVLYINESGQAGMSDALHSQGVAWTDAAFWPEPGAYIGAADPSGLIASGAWRPPVDPVFVQDRYLGTFDLSRTAGPWAARVLGYMDGPNSTWPADAWARFREIPDTAAPKEMDPMQIGVNPKTGNLIVVGSAKDNGHLLVFELVDDSNVVAPKWSVIDVTDAIGTNPRAYTVV